MSFKFLIAIDLILRLEGGPTITNDPRDPGGLTKFGISLSANPELGREGILTLDLERARAIYKKKYWDVIQGDELPIDIAICVFDCAVNQGPGTARMLLQEALRVKIDGIMGPITLNSIKTTNKEDLVSTFMQLRQFRYSKSEKFNIYGKGWSRRLYKVCRQSGIAKALYIALY